MKRLTYKLILLFVIGTCATAIASEPVFKKEFTREVNKTFDVSSNVHLAVQNKYGNISIETWSQNQVKIDVLIKVKSSNEEKAQKFLNEIEIDFDASSSKVSAQTIYPDNNKSWWSNWFGKGKNIDYEVHYKINAPGGMSSSIVNKYGNITQGNIDGDCQITNKYGDVFYSDIAGDLEMSLGYGKASIGSVSGDTKIQMKYSSLKMVECKDMEISTKYSDVKIKSSGAVTSYTKYDEYKIENLTSLKNDGKYDDFVIGTIDEIMIDTKYSDVNIGTLNRRASFETGYGNVNVKDTGSGLEKIAISSKYTGYRLDIAGDFHLNFEGSRTDLHVSKPYEKYNSEKDGGDLRLKAFRGSKDGAKISAYMKYGGLDIN